MTETLETPLPFKLKTSELEKAAAKYEESIGAHRHQRRNHPGILDRRWLKTNSCHPSAYWRFSHLFWKRNIDEGLVVPVGTFSECS